MKVNNFLVCLNIKKINTLFLLKAQRFKLYKEEKNYELERFVTISNEQQRFNPIIYSLNLHLLINI